MIIQILIKENATDKTAIAKMESFDFEQATVDLGKLERYMEKVRFAKLELELKN